MQEEKIRDKGVMGSDQTRQGVWQVFDVIYSTTQSCRCGISHEYAGWRRTNRTLGSRWGSSMSKGDSPCHISISQQGLDHESLSL